MSDKAASASFAEIVLSVQVPRDGGDNADATRASRPDPDAAGDTTSG